MADNLPSHFSDPEYHQWLSDIKERFQKTQIKAAVQVNVALLEFYWELGDQIVKKQAEASWGDDFLTNLSHDLMVEFPEIKGFSVTNLRYIKRWYLFYTKGLTNSVVNYSANQPQLVADLTNIPWGHNRLIISKCQSSAEALFYVHKTLGHGWSRAVLTHQIESGLYGREGKAITNFENTLPEAQSDLASQLLKDPYTFDFLSLSPDHNERQLENALTEHITKFLLELGAGFAYMGRQLPLTVGERDFFVDLLFYHTILHCYVVVELKTTAFEPEHAGKLNFYIKAVDEAYRKPGDESTIGILLCKNRDKLVAEYALSDINKPIGVSEYQLTQSLPEELKTKLPSVEDLEAELSSDLVKKDKLSPK